MTTFLDKIIGVYHFLGDRTPRNVPKVDPRPPKVNPWRKDDQVIVAKVPIKGDIRDTVDMINNLLGNAQKVYTSGDKVLIKPNFNSPNPFP